MPIFYIAAKILSLNLWFKIIKSLGGFIDRKIYLCYKLYDFMRCCAAQTRRTRMYSFLLALIYIAFISLGLPDSLLGSGWPVVHLELGVPISYMGIVSMVISGGTIVSSLMSDRLNRKLGTRIVTVISVFLTVIALFGFSFSSRFWMLIVFAVPYGLGAGAIDAALNNYVALHYKAKHMSWLHSFWGVGTIVSPFIMGYALTNKTWNSGCRIVGAIQLAIAILLLVTLPVWKVNKATDETEKKSVGLVGALKIKGVPFLLIGFSPTAQQKRPPCSGRAHISLKSRAYPQSARQHSRRCFI